MNQWLWLMISWAVFMYSVSTMHAFYTNKMRNSKWFEEIENKETGVKEYKYFSNQFKHGDGFLGYEGIIFAATFVGMSMLYMITLYADKYFKNPILYRVVCYSCLLGIFAAQ